MALKSALLAALLSATATLAQQETVWGSVVVALHGEKNPYLSFTDSHLTPFGANQAYNIGSVLRNRYLIPNSASNITDFHPLNGLTRNMIVNSQLDVLTLDEDYMFGSALSVVQGLYPPRGEDGPPPRTEEHWNASGNSLIEFPLDGYQYPNIKTVNLANSRSIAIAGQRSCDNYSTATQQYTMTDEYRDRVNDTLPFYQSLRASVFEGFPEGMATDYRAAWELYEYALYEYSHNETVREMNFTAQQLAILKDYATEEQFSLNAANHIGTIGEISGRSLAGKILERFNRLIAMGGDSWKLNLMVTSFEQFVSFFSAAGLTLQQSPSDGVFTKLPLHGSMMVFEIFTNSNNTDDFPSEDDLQVRFFFRNGTASNENLQEYPLFGYGPDRSVISWTDFRNTVADFAILNTGHWCYVCGAQTSFCNQLTQIVIGTPGSPSSESGGSNGRKVLSPAIYAIIGAVVILALLMLTAIVLAVLGFRLQRNDKNHRASDLGHLQTSPISAGAGGFKGAEKLASDVDLTLKGGAGATVIRHERVGSWELKDGPKSPTSLDKSVEDGRVRSMVDYGRRSEESARVDPFADPVRPKDHI